MCGGGRGEGQLPLVLTPPTLWSPALAEPNWQPKEGSLLSGAIQPQQPLGSEQGWGSTVTKTAGRGVAQTYQKGAYIWPVSPPGPEMGGVWPGTGA